jgi:hypothetical protein
MPHPAGEFGVIVRLESAARAEMVKVSPTWKPQSLNAMRRLEGSWWTTVSVVIPGIEDF